jgi:predicted secreted protein
LNNSIFELKNKAMANEKLNGSQIFLRKIVLVEDLPVEAFIVCEQTTEFSIESEGVTVQCKTTGEWVEQLAGGTKSGSISFTGAYVKDPTINNLSFEEIFDSVGLVEDYVWGGTEVGDFIIETKAKLTSLSISANQNEAVTFSITLTISDEPLLTTITT